MISYLNMGWGWNETKSIFGCRKIVGKNLTEKNREQKIKRNEKYL